MTRASPSQRTSRRTSKRRTRTYRAARADPGQADGWRQDLLWHERFNLEGGTLPERLESCRRAIRSGRFHSIVLSDLSEANHAIPSVERELGTTLQEFAHGGGTIAITTSDASVCVPMLQRVFEVAWEVGGYYTHKATWLPAKGNESVIADTFPGVQVIERGQRPSSPPPSLLSHTTRPPLLLADCCTVRRRAR